MFTKMFWRAALERAIKSAAQGAIGGTAAGVSGVFKDLHSAEAAGIAAASMFLLSILTSLGSAALTDGNPSVGSSEVLADPGNTAKPAGQDPVEVEAAPEAQATPAPARAEKPVESEPETDDTMPVAQPFPEDTTPVSMPSLEGQTTEINEAELPAPDAGH